MAKKASKVQLDEEGLALLNAVKTATSIQKGSSLSERQSHCRFTNGYVLATNDVMIVGMPCSGIAIDCCPHSKTLLAALERCQGRATFTMDGSTLVLKAPRLRVPIPCIEPVTLADLAPDMPQAPCGQDVAKAISAVVRFVEPSADRLICKPVYFGPNLIQGSFKAQINIQYWHGVANLPELAIPPESASAIASRKVDMKQIGTGSGTVTFWYEDNSFIKSSLYDIKTPDFNRSLECKALVDQQPIGESMWAALKVIQPFTNEKLGSEWAGTICFEDQKLWAGMPNSSNASFDYEEWPFDILMLNVNHLLMFENLVNLMIADCFERKLFLYGDNLRAVIAGRKERGV